MWWRRLLNVNTKNVDHRRLCFKIYIKSSQRMNKNDVKTRCTYKRWISFFCCSLKYERKVNVAPWASFTLHEPIAFILQCYFLPQLGPRFYVLWKFETQSEKHRRHFDGMHSDMSECGLLFFVYCISTYCQDTTSSNLFYLCVTLLTNII